MFITCLIIYAVLATLTGLGYGAWFAKLYFENILFTTWWDTIRVLLLICFVGVVSGLLFPYTWCRMILDLQ